MKANNVKVKRSRILDFTSGTDGRELDKVFRVVDSSSTTSVARVEK
jgi:hypothetical protein